MALYCQLCDIDNQMLGQNEHGAYPGQSDCFWPGWRIHASNLTRHRRTKTIQIVIKVLIQTNGNSNALYREGMQLWNLSL
jgi:hypothetical protein